MASGNSDYLQAPVFGGSPLRAVPWGQYMTEELERFASKLPGLPLSTLCKARDDFEGDLQKTKHTLFGNDLRRKVDFTTRYIGLLDVEIKKKVVAKPSPSQSAQTFLQIATQQPPPQPLSQPITTPQAAPLTASPGSMVKRKRQGRRDPDAEARRAEVENARQDGKKTTEEICRRLASSQKTIPVPRGWEKNFHVSSWGDVVEKLWPDGKGAKSSRARQESERVKALRNCIYKMISKDVTTIQERDNTSRVSGP